MLVWYIAECMVSIININNGIKKSLRVYRKCNINQMLTFGGYVKARKSLYNRVIAWVNTILNHSEARAILPRCEGSIRFCMVY